MQFSARHLAYKMQFPSAVQKVIEFGDRSAGSLIVERSTKRIFLIDIAIAREFQGKGIGTDLIRRLQDEAAGSAIPLMLHADKANLNAFNLYKKLAFKVTGETLVLYEMAWSASGK